MIYLSTVARTLAVLCAFHAILRYSNDFAGQFVGAFDVGVLWTISNLCERIDGRDNRDENDTAL